MGRGYPISGGPLNRPQMPAAGTSSGLPGASFPVMGSAPVSNMQPRLANPGTAQMRPGMAQPQPQAPGGAPQQPGIMPQPQQQAAGFLQQASPPGMANSQPSLAPGIRPTVFARALQGR